MGYRPGDTLTAEFVVSTAGGALVNADSLPTAALAHNGTDDGTVTLTVTNIVTGRYKVTGTIPSGYAGGDSIAVFVAASVSSVSVGQVLVNAVIDRPTVTLSSGDETNIGLIASLPSAAAIATAVWTAVASGFSTVGTLGYQFRRLYAALHGNFTATYTGTTAISTVFLDTDNTTTLATAAIALDGSGRPTTRSVT